MNAPAAIAATVSPTGAGLLLEALDRWAAEIGDQPAVTTATGWRDWRGVRADAGALADTLGERGIGPGNVVGLATGRSEHALTALLAVWACGATAVLLDERHLRETLMFMARDVGIDLLLAPAVDRTLLGLRVPILTVTAAAGTGDNAAAADIASWPAVDLDDPAAIAYLVYTSGTTGTPKGVEILAAGLDVLVRALQTLRLTPGGLAVNAVSPAFDGWLWCALLALVSGQGMALLDVAAQASDGVGALVKAQRPRTVSLTPSLLSACDTSLPGVELIVVAGEACPPALVERFGAGRRMINVYGPTEATIATTWADSAAGDDVRDIGRPLPGYRVHVLDDHGVEVGAGGTGELTVAGPAVARGYRNQPELTAARFVRDPSDGGRMYRTGDLVTRLADGTMRYRGRDDDQVKVRGFRVELAGLDRAAKAINGVGHASAFLVAGVDALGLAVSPRPGAALPTDAELLAHLAAALPAHTVPSILLRLDVLPTTGTGKVDRRALAETASAVSSAAADAASGPPMNERQAQIAAIWAEILEAPVTDVDADFFAIGGHSLLAARVVSQVRSRTGASITLRTLLAHPTVAALALAVDAEAAVQS